MHGYIDYRNESILFTGFIVQLRFSLTLSVRLQFQKNYRTSFNLVRKLDNLATKSWPNIEADHVKSKGFSCFCPLKYFGEKCQFSLETDSKESKLSVRLTLISRIGSQI